MESLQWMWKIECDILILVFPIDKCSYKMSFLLFFKPSVHWQYVLMSLQAFLVYSFVKPEKSFFFFHDDKLFEFLEKGNSITYFTQVPVLYHK